METGTPTGYDLNMRIFAFGARAAVVAAGVAAGALVALATLPTL